MPNPYSGGGSATSALSSVRADESGKGAQDLGASDLSARELLRRTLSFARPHAGFLLLSFACATVSVLLQLYVPIVIGQAIDCMVSASKVDLVSLADLLPWLAACVTLAALTQWVSLYSSSRVSYKTAKDLRNAAFGKLRHLELSFVDAHSHGDLLSRVTNDVDAVTDGLLQGFNQLFTGAVTIVGTLVYMCSLSGGVALAVVLITPLTFLAASWIARRSAASFRAQQQTQGELGGFVEEMISNHALASAFSHGREVTGEFSHINQRLYGVGERAQFVSSLTNPSTRLVNNLSYGMVAVLGCVCVVSGWPSPLSVGQVQSFLSYTNQYMRPFNEVSSVVTQLQSAFASAGRVFALLDAQEEPPDSGEALELDAPRGAVDLDHVCFSYRKDRPLLQDIDLHVRPGERIALVGPTGCGKTTLINLLLRFYEIDGGRIRIDGHDLRELSRRSLRAAFGMVLQDTWLFEGSVADNIRYGAPDATDEQVRAAAERAHAHRFIEQLPHGYDTPIGEGGGSLSAGQRQLLCIARVMLSDPAILLLDEATSSIDTRTELQVQDAFDRMIEGRSSIVVAHRLSTIKNADLIVFMDAGKIVERGTHEELLARGGRYAELYQSQFAR